MNKVKYSYVWMAGERGARDAYVLSIARTFDKETQMASFGWALNVPPKWTPINNSKFVGEALLGGDHFSRRAGRLIAEGRLRNKPVTMLVQNGSVPMKSILEHIFKSDKYPIMAKEIAKSELNKGWK